MSRQIRHRATGVALVALIVVTPLLAAEPAHADQVESGERVVFAGSGLLGLSCVAEPDVRSLGVPAGSTVTLVNDTGHGADLLLDGRPYGGIPANGSARVVFRRGMVEVSLQPDCLLSERSEAVLVTAATDPSTSSSPSPTPHPSDTVTPTASATPSKSTSSSVSPSATPTTTPPRTSSPATVRPTRSNAAPSRPDPVRPRTSAPHTTRPEPPDRAPAFRITTAMATTTAPPTSASAVPTDDPAIVAGLPTSEPPAADAGLPADAAAEPVAGLRPLPETSPAGLLALIAIVCVLGVLFGIIRAIVAERAIRSRAA